MKRLLPMFLAMLMVMSVFSVNGALASDAEIVDGRFVETRKITVEVYDRSNDGGTPPADNVFANFIKEGMLRDHNVEVEFVTVPRWTEDSAINNLLASGDAPDVCVTYNYPAIVTYANMGGVIDMAPLVEEHADLIVDMVDLIGEDNLYYDLDPNNGTLWAIEGRVFNNAGQKTFVREDWLAILDMAEPTTLEEFEAVLYAFRDNAELLLGDDAAQMIPYLLTFDIGWHNMDIVDAFAPADMTDKDRYVYGFDDRKLTYPNYKEVVRLLNKWYNEDLIWKDFPLYGEGDTTSDNLMKAGYVGSFAQNTDVPYRNGEDGIQNTMARLVSEDAAYVTVATFQNENGEYMKYWSAPVDRKVFFPATNDEPVASLIYLNWLCKLENRIYLHTGEEGINHERTEDGAYKMIAATGEYIFNSSNNLDYTTLQNGLALGSTEISLKSLALGYAGIDPLYIEHAYSMDGYTINYLPNSQLGEIAAEEGMSNPLKEKRNNMLNQAVVAPVDQFDAIYDAGMQDYLNSGGQAIIDERLAAWEAAYGDKVNLD